MTPSAEVAAPLAAAELLARRKARRSLIDFTRYTMPAYQPEPVHALIAATLNRVVSGEIRRLMIFAPPQHGKSELASVRLPAYWLGRRPDDPVMLTSYAASLAYDKSRQARAVVESDDFARLFPDSKTDQASRAVDHWSLAGHRGGMIAAGVGGPITGHGAALGLIDDPVENYEQAHSRVYRERAWDWYNSTFLTRLAEAGAIVLIMTRWHHDDLAGRLLKREAAEWTVLRLPALAETDAERRSIDAALGLPASDADPLGRAPGEALAPGRYSAPYLNAIKIKSSWTFGALYQGFPTLREGSLFKPARIKIVKSAPTGIARCRAWDMGATEDGGDPTAGALLGGPTPDGRYIILDMRRVQAEPSERNALIRQTAMIDGADVRVRGPQDPGAAGKESAGSFVRLLAGFDVATAPVSGAKELRAEPFAAQVNAGNVDMLEGEWNEALLDELSRFPRGEHDDQVDALSDAFAELAGVRAPGDYGVSFGDL